MAYQPNISSIGLLENNQADLQNYQDLHQKALQQLSQNQNAEQEKAAQYGFEHRLSPDYDTSGQFPAFKGYNPDVSPFAKIFANQQYQKNMGTLSPNVPSPLTDGPATGGSKNSEDDTSPLISHDPAIQAMFAKNHAKNVAMGIQTAGSPQDQNPMAPAPLYKDPKVMQEAGKQTGEAIRENPISPQSSAQGGVPIVADAYTGKALAPPPPQTISMGGANMPETAQRPNLDIDPLTTDQLIAQGTTTPHLQIPKTALNDLPEALLNKLGIDRNSMPNKFIPGTINDDVLRDYLSGEYGVQKANIMAQRGNIDDTATSLIKQVTSKQIDPGTAAEMYMEQTGQPPKKAVMDALYKAGTNALGQGNLAAHQQSVNQSAVMNAQNKIANDKVIVPYEMARDGAARVLDNLYKIQSGDPSAPKSNKQFSEIITNEIGRLDQGSRSAAYGSQEAQSYHSAMLDLGKLKDYFSGQPSDAMSPEQIQQAIKLTSGMRDNYIQAEANRRKLISSSALPNQQSTFEKSNQEFQNQTDPKIAAYQQESSRAKELLQQHKDDPNFPIYRRKAEQYLQNKYGKGLDSGQ